MKLVLIISSLRRGGAEKVMAFLANALAERGHSMTLLTWDAGTETAYPLHPSIARVGLRLQQQTARLPERLWRTLQRVAAVRRAIRQIRPDGVLSFIDMTNILTLLATLGAGVPVIVAERIDPRYWPRERLRRVLRLCAYPFARRVVVQTRYARRYFPRWLRRKVVCIPNPVFADTAFEAADRALLLIAVGRLEAQKRVDLLLDAFARCGAAYDAWRLVVIGEGTEKEALIRRCNGLGLAHRVDFTGQVADLSPHLKSAAIFAMASDFEGFPNALGEAMSAGLAVVSTATAGAKALIRNGADGLLVPPGDSAALADALKKLMDDGALRRRLGARARDAVMRYSPATIAGRWESFIAGTIQGRARGR